MVVSAEPFSFCQSANRGIGASSGAWVLLLNDDVVLAPHFLERLLAGVPADGRIGMVCGKLLASDGQCLDSTGQFVSRAFTAVERGHGEPDRGQYDVPGYVFSVPGAAGLYRRQMLEELAINGQPFDERLGMYLEDLELGLRAQRAGWRAYYVPQAVATHVRGATAKTRRPPWRWLARSYLPWLAPELQARYVLNRYAVMRRYGSVGRLLRDSPWLLWYELRLWGYLLGLSRSTLRVILRAPRVRG
jgi:GT2 family glycosyltransferase